MTDHSIDISCNGPTPSVTKVSEGDSVTFHNTTGADVTITFGDSGVFNPSPGQTITFGTHRYSNSRVLHIGKIGSGTNFDYPDCGRKKDTRSGRIDP